MRLIFENVSQEVAPTLINLAKALQIECKQEVGLTKFESEILQASKEVKERAKRGELECYSDMQSFKQAILNEI
ncbi:hypothetical protein BKH46_06485 [Helicobacter sp. 12S02634-8]|uniref:hypothetical protein n=1 Tax=Helicobacter sp. 12S02634-8 TaxID=1476199 RepID=UPI000BD1DF74|nr:hypothetical protein [Helicobacter sp. 12S02634-8]PAF46864.1 hypothetical protein BKH46_06485 [Helicobacter sp. 12S02634-8]